MAAVQLFGPRAISPTLAQVIALFEPTPDEVAFAEAQDDMMHSGFVYINGRWVLMLRPWQGLE